MITVDIPADFNHYGRIFEPVTVDMSMKPFYSIALPNAPKFVGCRVSKSGNIIAKSQQPPIIMIGDGSVRDANDWSELTNRANTWRVPLDVLLTERPLKIACDLWTPTGRFATGHQSVNLVAVQILGDLTKSVLLDERIAEIKSWFD